MAGMTAVAEDSGLKTNTNQERLRLSAFPEEVPFLRFGKPDDCNRYDT